MDDQKGKSFFIPDPEDEDGVGTTQDVMPDDGTHYADDAEFGFCEPDENEPGEEDGAINEPSPRSPQVDDRVDLGLSPIRGLGLVDDLVSNSSSSQEQLLRDGETDNQSPPHSSGNNGPDNQLLNELFSESLINQEPDGGEQTKPLVSHNSGGGSQPPSPSVSIDDRVSDRSPGRNVPPPPINNNPQYQGGDWWRRNMKKFLLGVVVVMGLIFFLYEKKGKTQPIGLTAQVVEATRSQPTLASTQATQKKEDKKGEDKKGEEKKGADQSFGIIFFVPLLMITLILTIWYKKSIRLKPTRRGWILLISLLWEIILFWSLYRGVFPEIIEVGFFIFLSTTVCTLGLFAVLVYFWWAPNNLCFTFVDEGRAKIIVKAGEFSHALMQWQGHTFFRYYPKSDARHWEVVPIQEGEVSTGDGAIVRYTPTEPYHFFGGLRWYGIWPLYDIYIYNFRWTGIQEDGQEITRSEILDFVLLKEDVYFAKVEKAEDEELLPLDLNLLLTILVRNPYKALFLVQRWLEAVLNRMVPIVRDRVTEHTYGEWIKNKQDLAKRIFEDPETGKIIEEFMVVYGVELKKLEVRDINPPADFRERTLQKYTAERQKDATIAAGEAEAKRLETIAQAYERHPEVWKVARLIEALEKSPGEGAKWILPLPGLADLISQVTSGKKTEQLNEEDLKALKDVISQSKKQNAQAI